MKKKFECRFLFAFLVFLSIKFFSFAALAQESCESGLSSDDRVQAAHRFAHQLDFNTIWKDLKSLSSDEPIVDGTYLPLSSRSEAIEARRQALVFRLRQMGLRPELARTEYGTHVIVEIPGQLIEGEKTQGLVEVVARLSAEDVDDATGAALMLGLAGSLSTHSIQVPTRFVFFDGNLSKKAEVEAYRAINSNDPRAIRASLLIGNIGFIDSNIPNPFGVMKVRSQNIAKEAMYALRRIVAPLPLSAEIVSKSQKKKFGSLEFKTAEEEGYVRTRGFFTSLNKEFYEKYSRSIAIVVGYFSQVQVADPSSSSLEEVTSVQLDDSLPEPIKREKPRPQQPPKEKQKKKSKTETKPNEVDPIDVGHLQRPVNENDSADVDHLNLFRTGERQHRYFFNNNSGPTVVVNLSNNVIHRVKGYDERMQFFNVILDEGGIIVDCSEDDVSWINVDVVSLISKMVPGGSHSHLKLKDANGGIHVISLREKS